MSEYGYDGKLKKVYEVWCAQCGECEYLHSSYNRSEKQLRGYGWRKRQGRWICSKCVEAAKEPQP